MTETLVEVVSLAQATNFRWTDFSALLYQQIEQLNLLFLNRIFLEKVIVQWHKLRGFLCLYGFNKTVYYPALYSSDDFKMEWSLTVGSHSVAIVNSKAFPLVPFDELILENLKCMQEWLIILLKEGNFLWQHRSLRPLLFQLLEKLPIFLLKMFVFLLKPDQFLLDGLDEDLLWLLRDLLFIDVLRRLGSGRTDVLNFFYYVHPLKNVLFFFCYL